MPSRNDIRADISRSLEFAAYDFVEHLPCLDSEDFTRYQQDSRHDDQYSMVRYGEGAKGVAKGILVRLEKSGRLNRDIAIKEFREYIGRLPKRLVTYESSEHDHEGVTSPIYSVNLIPYIEV